MSNVGSYLIMKEFSKSDSVEIILEKLKDMFEINQHFANTYDDEYYFVEDEDEKTYNSQLEEIFYKNYKNNMSLLELKDLIDKIGNALVDLYDEEYGNFNISYIEKEDYITIAISLCVYFI